MARQETVRIPCELEANPRDVVFAWRFNNTMDAIDIPPGLISSEGSQSIVSYTPTSELDYGTLLCSGTNEQGAQSEPCVFLVVPAGECVSLCVCVTFPPHREMSRRSSPCQPEINVCLWKIIFQLVSRVEVFRAKVRGRRVCADSWPSRYIPGLLRRVNAYGYG